MAFHRLRDLVCLQEIKWPDARCVVLPGQVTLLSICDCSRFPMSGQNRPRRSHCINIGYFAYICGLDVLALCLFFSQGVC